MLGGLRRGMGRHLVIEESSDSTYLSQFDFIELIGRVVGCKYD